MNWQISILGRDYPHPQLFQSGHQRLDGFLVAGDGTSAEDYRVARLQLKIRMGTRGQSAQSRSRLALTARGHGQHFVPREIPQMCRIDQLVSRIPQPCSPGGATHIDQRPAQ